LNSHILPFGNGILKSERPTAETSFSDSTIYVVRLKHFVMHRSPQIANPPRLACVSRSLAQVEPWDEILPLAESRGGTPKGERAALCARRPPLGCGGWIRVSRRSASLLSSVVTFVAQGADREDTGIHRRCSLTKIGVESEKILRRDDDSGANRIARTRLLVIARSEATKQSRGGLH